MTPKILALFLLIFVFLTGCASTTDWEILGPMVQIGDTNGITEIIIVWRTSQPMDSRVEYGNYIEQVVFDHNPVRYHAVRLENLDSDTYYHYRIFGNGRILAASIFKTAKLKNQPFRFAVFGDSGNGAESQYDVAEEVARQNPDFIIHTGDLVYTKGEDANYPEYFYYPYRNLIPHIPFLPSLGNHDYETENGSPFLKNFVLPSEESYYSFDYGNAHFVALNSNKVDQYSSKWLENDLSKTRQLWKIVYFHHPPPFVPGHVGDEAILKLWVPIFEKYKVDLVFCGHKHVYARFKPINGVQYIIEGTGGKRLYGIGNTSHLSAWYNEDWGFGLVEVDGTKLNLCHITRRGEVKDMLVLEK